MSVVTCAASEQSSAKPREFSKNSARLRRERQTLVAMLHCHCRAHGGSAAQLCPECQDLLNYALMRLDRCRFGEAKPTCAKCPVHCYNARRREQIKTVMRQSGPRMLWQHPVLALRHWLDSLQYRQASVSG